MSSCPSCWRLPSRRRAGTSSPPSGALHTTASCAGLAGATAEDLVASRRQLVCKVEEIHTTLRKHLAKEEEQLFPLLLQHFTHSEQARPAAPRSPIRPGCTGPAGWHDTGRAAQAELVAQFLCCIPLTTVDAVLGWLKPSVPPQEQEELLQQVRGSLGRHLWVVQHQPCNCAGSKIGTGPELSLAELHLRAPAQAAGLLARSEGRRAQVRGVVPDHLLLQLLVTWLSPVPKPSKAAPHAPELSPQGCCRSQPSPSQCTKAHRAAGEQPPLQARAAPEASAAACSALCTHAMACSCCTAAYAGVE